MPGHRIQLFAEELLSLDEVVSRVQRNYNNITTYQAEFSQQITSTSIDRKISQGKGRVVYKKPGKMYWHYSEPEEHYYITDGSTLWDYLPEEKQVVIMGISQVLTQKIPRAFLFGMGELKKDFEISFHSGRITDSAGNYWLDLIPKDEKERQTMGRIQFRVDPEKFMVREAELLDPLANKNHLAFKGIQVNKKVNDNLFSFQVPEGVEVIKASGMIETPEP
jgi:outer membrane lipoprotein carrier protein